MRFSFPYTEKQRQLVSHPARIVWCGTGTKTGKSAASYCWLIEGLLRGEACAFVGPWFFRSKRAYDESKNLLQPWISARRARPNEARLQITAGGGGYIDFLSADNPDCLFGGNYHRVVIDEASRCPSEIYPAALTVISATHGKLRLLFNLELGNKNWAISNLLRVQRLSPEERERTGEDYMTFPTDPALVDPDLVNTLRKQMPLPLWEALYLGKIPESDASLFRNLDKIFNGRELSGPEDGARYFLAADLARKTDWTVVTVIDDAGRVVATERFNQVSWSLQVERVALIYRTFRCGKAIYDATGIGDVIGEEFEKAGMTAEPFIFTVPSRRALVEGLVLSCDAGEISIPDTAKFSIYRQELESMELQLDGTSVRYSVPNGQHDDAVMSLALAAHAFRESRGAILGFVELLKKRAKEIADGVRNFVGELIHKPKPEFLPAPKPAPLTQKETVVNNFKRWVEEGSAPACPACGATCTIYIAGMHILCNQCACVDGQPVRSEITVGVNCCGNPLLQTISNSTRCGNCGQQSNMPAATGFSFAHLRQSRSRFSLRG